ncbi:hypothetical protein [Arthrobacter sp. MSA 4-2]|uniref:hypothetical protein n=1 Tax=Arthrobacter sp. MSA 4-2 TaxID=2794349 RepID=UPI001E323306|nr:hypothetical protein [Arthrobacter sp. MSA 4-2]
MWIAANAAAGWITIHPGAGIGASKGSTPVSWLTAAQGPSAAPKAASGISSIPAETQLFFHRVVSASGLDLDRMQRMNTGLIPVRTNP